MDSFSSSLLFWPISLLAGTLAGFFSLIPRSHDQLYTLRTRYCSFFCSFFFCFYSFFFLSLETPPIWFRVIVKQKKNKKKDHAYRSSVFATALVFFVKYLYFICFLRGRLYPAWDTCFYTSVFTRIDCIFISQF